MSKCAGLSPIKSWLAYEGNVNRPLVESQPISALELTQIFNSNRKHLTKRTEIHLYMERNSGSLITVLHHRLESDALMTLNARWNMFLLFRECIIGHNALCTIMHSAESAVISVGYTSSLFAGFSLAIYCSKASLFNVHSALCIVHRALII